MKKLLSIFMILFIFIFIFHVKNSAFAQDSVAEVAQAAISQDASGVVPSGGEKVVSALDDVEKKIPSSFPTLLLGCFVFVIEAFVRFVPTAKPKSLLLVIAAVLALLGKIFAKLSGLADILVQNTKDDPSQPKL